MGDSGYADTDGLEELAGLICFRVAAWRDFGYEDPPAPECTPIPPLGERSAAAVEAGREALGDIGRLIARLGLLRAQLADELRRDEDMRTGRQALEGIITLAWCKRCRSGTGSVPCPRCDGPACERCGRCPPCDGPVPDEEGSNG